MTPAAFVAASLLLFCVGLALGEAAKYAGRTQREQIDAAARLKTLADAEMVRLDGADRPLRVVGQRDGETAPVVVLVDPRHRYHLTADRAGRFVLERESARYPNAVTVSEVRID